MSRFRLVLGPLARVGLAIALCGVSACEQSKNGQRNPLQALDLFCRYETPFIERAVIEVDGERLEDAIVIQHSYSRRWIEQMNGGGCSRTFGTALTFRTRDGRAILMRPYLCRQAKKQLSSGGVVDVLGDCAQRARNPATSDAVMIDSADHPSAWTEFDFDGVEPPARLLALTAKRTHKAGRDNIELVAPALLTTDFGARYSGPNELISFTRRSWRNPTYHAVERPEEAARRPPPE